MNARVLALQILAKCVVAKQTRAFAPMDCPSTIDPTDQITTAVVAINKTISLHNDRTRAFSEQRSEVFRRLERHYAAQFVLEQKYNELLQELDDLEAAMQEKSRSLIVIDAELHQLEHSVSEAVKGADRVNELLVAYFGKDELSVILSSEKRFHIVRGEVVAKNLSDGEKTAIAFAYFITRVQDGRTPLASTIIVIDDPISSLDANHLFNTYALIKTQLANCAQLFLSTHSFDFFNLIREWAAEEDDTKRPAAIWKKWGIFLVKRTDKRHAVLEEIPKELLKFKSEYHYLFSVLYNFNASGAGDFDRLLSLPNVVRRFLEAFAGVMIPRSTGLKGKMERLFPNAIARERVWKFVNYYSHNTTLTRSLVIPDLSECKAVVQVCVDCVRDWDCDYFNDLVTEVT
jgi:wobble nucleotide-excising tRNase